MRSNNTWADMLAEFTHDCIERIKAYFAAEDADEFEKFAPDNGKINIEIHLSIKARKR